MEFKELVRKNRSCRGFDESRKITREELVELVDLARMTPAGMNKQVFSYYLAYEKEQLDMIQPLTKWAAALSELNLPREGERPTGYIIICQDLNLSDNLVWSRANLGIVAQTICLGATEMGVACCMIGSFNGNAFKEAAGLAEHYVPLLAIAIGKSIETTVLTEADDPTKIDYYRDENDVHYVPKRKLEDILL